MPKKPATIATAEKATRPPVVVVMGHIDHGKTTLLDYIRQSNVAVRESGGITQHIGAYEVEQNGNKITFLDTPGHGAFSRMRVRGARVADIGILVVAADDGVKPQTLEALKAAQDAELPYIVAITKIDKPDANPDKVKGELAEHGVLLEGWGGSIPVAHVSGKTGDGIPNMLELISLLADLEELTADPAARGKGVVIESQMDARRGVTATLLITDGTLSQGDWVVAGCLAASIKTLEDYKGASIDKATFSSPVRVLGFTHPPAVGDEFIAYKNKKDAEEALRAIAVPVNESKAETGESASAVEGAVEPVTIPLVLRSDVAGSREAIEGEIAKLVFPEVRLRILRSDVGDITDDDIKFVISHPSAIVLGFKVKIGSAVKSLAEQRKVEVKTFDIIYELLEWLEKVMEERIPAEVSKTEEGKLKVLKIFKKERNRQVFGGKVTSGVVTKGRKFEVIRAGRTVGEGKITSLQKNKVDADEVREGFECGLAGEVSVDLMGGDTLSLYQEQITKKKLRA